MEGGNDHYLFVLTIRGSKGGQIKERAECEDWVIDEMGLGIGREMELLSVQ